MEWIDFPVANAVNYFLGTAASFMTWAVQLGTLIGLLGICWSCVKLAFGTLEPQKAIVGTILKFLMFVAVLNFYPGACKVLQSVAIQMGMRASPKADSVITSKMIELQETLEKTVSDQVSRLSGRVSAAEEVLNRADTNPLTATMQDASSGVAVAVAKKKLDKYMNESGDVRTLDAVYDILVPLDENGNRTDRNLAKKYVLGGMMLKDSQGRDTQYLSPNAMLKIGVLAGNITWAKMFSDADENKKNSTVDTGSAKTAKVAGFPLYRIFDYVLAFVCRITIIAAIIFAILQYVMCLIEFTIVTSVSIICIPCMLMDELKDVAQKVLPSMLAQAMKLVLITMSMYFCMWVFLDFASQVIYSNTEFNLTTFAYVLFAIFLAFAVTQSAPKIAAAIMTGQPQLSMGEMVAAMGTAAAMGGIMARGTMTGASAIKTATPIAARGGVNALGGLNAVMSAGSMASNIAGAAGKNKALGFMQGAAGEMGFRAKRNLQSKLTNIAHSGLQSQSPRGGGADRTDDNTPVGETVGTNRFAFDGTGQATSFGYAKKDGAAMSAGEFISHQGDMAKKRAIERYAKKE